MRKKFLLVSIPFVLAACGNAEIHSGTGNVPQHCRDLAVLACKCPLSSSSLPRAFGVRTCPSAGPLAACFQDKLAECAQNILTGIGDH